MNIRMARSRSLAPTQENKIVTFPRRLYTTSTKKPPEWRAIIGLAGGGEIDFDILEKDQKKPLIEIQTQDITQLGAIKAIDAWMRSGRVSHITEDVSFGIDLFGGWPGPYYASGEKAFGQEVFNAHLHAMLKGQTNRGATASIVIAYVDGDDVCTISVTHHGFVPEVIAGGNGFGWDSLFSPDGLRTYAEMAPAEKNASSFRRDAINRLVSGDVQRTSIISTLLGPYMAEIFQLTKDLEELRKQTAG